MTCESDSEAIGYEYEPNSFIAHCTYTHACVYMHMHIMAYALHTQQYDQYAYQKRNHAKIPLFKKTIFLEKK